MPEAVRRVWREMRERILGRSRPLVVRRRTAKDDYEDKSIRRGEYEDKAR